MKNRTGYTFVMLVLFTLMLTGCSDMIEVQNRDFILAMGISEKNHEYEIVFANADYAKDTKKGLSYTEKTMKNYSGKSLNEIEKAYNLSSDKRLDYRHLQIIILDEKISSNQRLLMDFIDYVKNSYELSRTVLVYYYPGDINDLFDMDSINGSSIGNFINKLDENNRKQHNLKPTTIGDMMNAFSEGYPIVIPSFAFSGDTIRIDGGAVFYDAVCREVMSGEDLMAYYILKGQGREYLLSVYGDFPILLKNIKSKYLYDYKDGVPEVLIEIRIKAEPQGTYDMDLEELGDRVKERVESLCAGFIQYYVGELRLDVLRFYDYSAIKHKSIWMDYQNGMTDFLTEMNLSLSVYVEIE